MELEKVFNRGFWHGGYYLGKQLGEWSGVYGSKATKEKIYLGRAKNYFTQPKIGEFHLETGEINEGDEIIITGPTTGVIQTTVGSIFVNEKKTDSAVKGQEVTIPIENKIRANDKLFKVIDVA